MSLKKILFTIAKTRYPGCTYHAYTEHDFMPNIFILWVNDTNNSTHVLLTNKF